MTPERYQALMTDSATVITREEWEQGWHYCPELDYLLCQPGQCGFIKQCTCLLGEYPQD